MLTFNFRLPSHIVENSTADPRNIPGHQIVNQIKTAWAGRAPLPAGGFDALVTVPVLTGDTRDRLHEPVASYVYRALRLAGVLDARPTILGVRFQAGNVAEPEVRVGLTQLRWPDGTPAVLPREEAPCAA